MAWALTSFKVRNQRKDSRSPNAPPLLLSLAVSFQGSAEDSWNSSLHNGWNSSLPLPLLSSMRERGTWWLAMVSLRSSTSDSGR